MTKLESLTRNSSYLIGVVLLNFIEGGRVITRHGFAVLNKTCKYNLLKLEIQSSLCILSITQSKFGHPNLLTMHCIFKDPWFKT